MLCRFHIYSNNIRTELIRNVLHYCNNNKILHRPTNAPCCAYNATEFPVLTVDPYTAKKKLYNFYVLYNKHETTTIYKNSVSMHNNLLQPFCIWQTNGDDPPELPQCVVTLLPLMSHSLSGLASWQPHFENFIFILAVFDFFFLIMKNNKVFFMRR